MSVNPYSPPEADGNLQSTSQDPSNLAGRFTRFAAAMVDGFLMMAIIFPVQWVSGYLDRVSNLTAGPLEGILYSVFGLIVLFALNGYLLKTRGQTIGKLATSIQIVDARQNALLPLKRVFVYRYLWFYPFSILALLIPGQADDMLFNLVPLIDAVMIFGADRRCLHDYIAGSRVVFFVDGREHLAD